MQLHRPTEYIEADERIAKAEAEGKFDEKAGSVKSELIETKETV